MAKKRKKTIKPRKNRKTTKRKTVKKDLFNGIL